MPTGANFYELTVAASGATAVVPPTLSSQGISLSARTGFRVVVSAVAAQTLTSGSLYVYLWHPVLARWCLNAELKKDLDSTHSGVRDATFGDFDCTVAPWGGVYVTPHNMAISGGSNVVVRIDVY